MRTTFLQAARRAFTLVTFGVIGCSSQSTSGTGPAVHGSPDPLLNPLLLACAPNGDSGAAAEAGELEGGPEVCAPNAACLVCETQQCPDLVAGCDAFDGAGRQACIALLQCVRSTSCHAVNLLNCYCGTADATQCLASSGDVANGACRAEIERAQGTSDPTAIQNQFTDVSTPGGAALYLSLCDTAVCANECIPYVTTCGSNGADAGVDEGNGGDAGVDRASAAPEGGSGDGD